MLYTELGHYSPYLYTFEMLSSFKLKNNYNNIMINEREKRPWGEER